MEKIIHPPLIDHLKAFEEQYNQMYQQTEVRYGAIDRRLLVNWITGTVEPIVKLSTLGKQEKLPELFKTLYSEVLNLLGNKQGIVYEHEYKDAWRLCLKVPSLMADSPKRLIQAINSGIVSIRIHQPQKVFYWVMLMDRVIHHCKTVEEFLNCGRVNAWLIGVAHMRVRAIQALQELPEILINALNKNSPVRVPFKEICEKRWIGIQKATYMGEVGGFVGMNGNFISPPLVAHLDGQIVASDGSSASVLFADVFGKVMIADVPLDAIEIKMQATTKDLENFNQRYDNHLIPFNDISSCIIKDSTFVCTRNSSHYLYVVALPQ